MSHCNKLNVEWENGSFLEVSESFSKTPKNCLLKPGCSTYNRNFDFRESADSEETVFDGLEVFELRSLHLKDKSRLNILKR